MIMTAIHNIIGHPIEAILAIALMLAFDLIFKRRGE